MKNSSLIIAVLGIVLCLSCKKEETAEEKIKKFHSITVKVKRSNDDNEQVAEFKRQELKVLEKADPKEIVFFDLVDAENPDLSRLQYLGIIDNGEGVKLKVLTRFIVTGNEYNTRGASSIELYDSDNKLYGQYPVGFSDDLPDAIEDGDWIYLRDIEGCEKRRNYIIKLDGKLPKEIFIPCDKDGGNLFSFVKE